MDVVKGKGKLVQVLLQIPIESSGFHEIALVENNNRNVLTKSLYKKKWSVDDKLH